MDPVPTSTVMSRDDLDGSSDGGLLCGSETWPYTELMWTTPAWIETPSCTVMEMVCVTMVRLSSVRPGLIQMVALRYMHGRDMLGFFWT